MKIKSEFKVYRKLVRHDAALTVSADLNINTPFSFIHKDLFPASWFGLLHHPFHDRDQSAASQIDDFSLVVTYKRYRGLWRLSAAPGLKVFDVGVNFVQLNFGLQSIPLKHASI